MSKRYEVTANLDYVDGHLRYGYKQMFLSEEEVKRFNALEEIAQSEWLRDSGEVIVTDWEINGYGGLDDIEVREVSNE